MVPRIIFILALLLPCAARGAAPESCYFVAVKSGGVSEESYKALQGMVKLAGERSVSLTLLFSPQYADYIATDTARLAELGAWKKAGHEIGAYHRGPEGQDWDGYSDLGQEELARLGRPAAAGGHAEYFAALARLEPALKTACLTGQADKAFAAAGPAYEVCAADPRAYDPALVRRDLTEGARLARAAAGGVNESAVPGPHKNLYAYNPAGKPEIEAAQAAFSGMGRGAYGAVFNASPSEFGAFYAWLTFLSRKDPQGLRSRTVSAAPACIPAPARKSAPRSGVKKDAVKRDREALLRPDPPEVQAQPSRPAREIPKLKPVQSFFGSVERPGPKTQKGWRPPAKTGYCGDGICDVFERAVPGLCPRDCGK